MIEALAPFYGLDPEPDLATVSVVGPPDVEPRANAKWLEGALQAAEERVRDLEEELSEVEREAQTLRDRAEELGEPDAKIEDLETWINRALRNPFLLDAGRRAYENVLDRMGDYPTRRAGPAAMSAWLSKGDYPREEQE